MEKCDSGHIQTKIRLPPVKFPPAEMGAQRPQRRGEVALDTRNIPHIVLTVPLPTHGAPLKRTLALSGVAAGLLASALVAQPASAAGDVASDSLAKTSLAAKNVVAYWF